MMSRMRGWPIALSIALLALLAAFWAWRGHRAQTMGAETAVEVIAGGDGGGLPRADAVAEGFDAVALQAAVDLARQQNLGALLIARHGHLIVEQYGGGADADTLVAGGGLDHDLDATVVLLAAGVAVVQNRMIMPARPFESVRLIDAITRASQLRYPQFLSRNLWQPLNAAAAHWSATGLSARASDWLRLAELLLHDGRFEGTQVIPKGWVQFAAKPHATSGAEPLAADDGYVLQGLALVRLWLMPRLDLAIVQVKAASSSTDQDETRLPNKIIRALRDRQAASGVSLNDLVPGH